MKGNILLLEEKKKSLPFVLPGKSLPLSKYHCILQKLHSLVFISISWKMRDQKDECVALPAVPSLR